MKCEGTPVDLDRHGRYESNIWLPPSRDYDRGKERMKLILWRRVESVEREKALDSRAAAGIKYPLTLVRCLSVVVSLSNIDNNSDPQLVHQVSSRSPSLDIRTIASASLSARILNNLAHTQQRPDRSVLALLP